MAAYYYEENLNRPFRVHLRDTFDFPTHLHHQVEICIQVKGEQEVSVDGRSATLESGDAALMLPNSVHSYRLVTPGRCVVAIFDPSYAGAFEKIRALYLTVGERYRRKIFDSLRTDSVFYNSVHQPSVSSYISRSLFSISVFRSSSSAARI